MTTRILQGDCQPRDRGRFVPGVHAYRLPQPHWEKAWLEREYLELKRSASEIAKGIGCGETNVDYWLRKHGIKRRSVSEARAVKHWGVVGSENPMFGRFGPLNPRYVDGSSPERQRLYAHGSVRAFLRAVLKRDGYRCVRCSAPKAGPKSLHVHHLKSWAGNVALRFVLDNAVTLCRRCHNWVHSKKNTQGDFLS